MTMRRGPRVSATTASVKDASRLGRRMFGFPSDVASSLALLSEKATPATLVRAWDVDLRRFGPRARRVEVAVPDRRVQAGLAVDQG